MMGELVTGCVSERDQQHLRLLTVRTAEGKKVHAIALIPVAPLADEHHLAVVMTLSGRHSPRGS